MILILGFIVSKQYRFINNAVSIYIGYLLIFYCEKRGIIKTSKLVKSLFVLVIVLHLAFGQYLKLYETSLYFDKGLHLLGTFTISLFIYQALVSLVGVNFSSRLLVFIFISSVGITAGVLLEMFEFALDIMFKSYNQKGLNDTNFDMIFNIFGACLAGLSAITTNKFRYFLK